MTKKEKQPKTPVRPKTSNVSHMPDGGYWESPVKKVSYFPDVVNGLETEFVPKQEKETQTDVEVKSKKKQPRVKVKASKRKPIKVKSCTAAKQPEYLMHTAAILVVLISLLVGVLMIVVGQAYMANAMG